MLLRTCFVKTSMYHCCIRPHTRTLRCSRIRSVTNDSIFMPYFQLYTEAVCANVPERAQEMCILSMRVPDFGEQQEIVDAFLNIQKNMDLGSAEGAVFLLLQKHDDTTLEYLLQTITTYHDSLNTIRAIVSDTLESII